MSEIPVRVYDCPVIWKFPDSPAKCQEKRPVVTHLDFESLQMPACGSLLEFLPMKKSILLSFWLGAIFSLSVQGQSGCPGCTTALPPLPSDTIYLGTAPDGIAGIYYDGDLSFRMPKSTTPVNAVDPGTPAGLGISKITIISVLNVPPGLDWEPSQFEFDPDNQTDGCVKFCGVPLQSGQYEVEVFVTAEVSLITQSTSFTFPFYIAPAVSSNDGFSLTNGSGCGSLTVQVANNLPSYGNPGFSYFWDFGNGSTSTVEDPGAVTYTNPGTYYIDYLATIDTFGYELTTVQVVAAGCDDTALPPIFNGAPDLYIKIKDPNGVQIFSTSPVTNSPIPSAFNVNLMLGPGDYELEVRDDDLIGSDGCGKVIFNRNTTDTLVNGDLKVITNIIHPVFMVPSTDTVYVYDIPAPPAILPDGLIEICSGDEVLLTTDYQDNIQWRKDSMAIPGQNAPEILLSADGLYTVEYTSPEGCKSVSEAVEILNHPLPYPPAFHSDGNLLVLNNPSLLPSAYALQWYIGGEIIPGATADTYCNTTSGVSLYSLEVTDLETGCSNDFIIGVAFDPDFDCTVSTKDLFSGALPFRLFPNPASDHVQVECHTGHPVTASITIRNPEGKTVLTTGKLNWNAVDARSIDLSGLPAGMYFLEWSDEQYRIIRKLIRQ